MGHLEGKEKYMREKYLELPVSGRLSPQSRRFVMDLSKSFVIYIFPRISLKKSKKETRE